MTFEKYIKKKGKRYRLGFTTGSAAAAAAKAAVYTLIKDEKKEIVEIDTPYGIKLELEPVAVHSGDNWGRAAVIKDAGDDPDITDGLKIRARVEKIAENKIVIAGGEGVGEVTRPGLPVSPGKAAINPVPRKMIGKAVKAVIPEEQGIKIIIEVPRGREVAEKTFNPRLGIKGGISILGTTGIVEPMSESAYRESLALELKQAVAAGSKELVLVFGNYGKNLAQELGFEDKSVVKISNFVGYMLDQGVELSSDINRILLIGHIGKIVKVAGGIFNTHSKKADARKEIIAAYSALKGADQEVIAKIFAANTAEAAANILLQHDLKEVFSVLAERVAARIKERVDNKIETASLIFSMEKGILGSSGLDELKKEVDKEVKDCE